MFVILKIGIDKMNDDCDELYISFLFPPSDYVSGITVFKRIAQNNKRVDVLQANFESPNCRELNKYVDDYINRRIIVDMDCKVDWANCIFKFIDRGLKAIDKEYERIYSRSWLMANHFLACEYKFKHPDVFWCAEFSDPVMYDLNNNVKYYRQMQIDDEEYIGELNNRIKNFNTNNGLSLPSIENDSSAYFIAEYIVYLFADKVIFTNENQREIMLSQFPVDIRELVMEKSEIKMHPTLGEEFYNLKSVDLNMDDNDVNLAYFGNDYYGKRHFESLFYAFESLNHKFKDKVKIHMFINDDKLLKRVIPSDNFIIHKPMDYLEFLSATRQFDVLIVNDAVTRENFRLNPYLPSKLSDYLGSGKDVWALYENGSSLSKFDLSYKSDIEDYDSCSRELIKILKDHGYDDEQCSIDRRYINSRFTELNELHEREYRRILRLEKEIKKLKKENKEMKSSRSWKITSPLRTLNR